MPLTFNIRHVEKHDLLLEGELPVEELDLQIHDELLHFTGPLQYQLTAERLEGGILVRGDLRLPMDCECARCLKRFPQPLELHNWTCHLALTGEDAEPVKNDLVDLTPHIREDSLLALPQHPLCEAGCEGMKMPSAGNTPGSTSEKTSSAWDELNKLKL
jgi:uncharacterized protein